MAEKKKPDIVGDYLSLQEDYTDITNLEDTVLHEHIKKFHHKDVADFKEHFDDVHNSKLKDIVQDFMIENVGKKNFTHIKDDNERRKLAENLADSIVEHSFMQYYQVNLGKSEAVAKKRFKEIKSKS